jgi:hypothetical protein
VHSKERRCSALQLPDLRGADDVPKVDVHPTITTNEVSVVRVAIFKLHQLQGTRERVRTQIQTAVQVADGRSARWLHETSDVPLPGPMPLGVDLAVAEAQEAQGRGSQAAS